MTVEWDALQQELIDDPFAFDHPDYMFWSEAHCLAAEKLAFAFKNAIPIVVFTGAAGSGKSEIAKAVVDELSAGFLLGYIDDPLTLDHRPVHRILDAFGADPTSEEDEHVLTCLLQNSLAAMRHDHGLPSLIVDHADRLEENSLIALFSLASAHHAPEDALFKLILIGGTELQDRLARLVPQAIGPSFHLDKMSDDDTKDYIRHRLASAQYKSMMFTEDALETIVKHSDGNARHINIICTASLDRFRNSTEDRIESELVKKSLASALARRPQAG